MTASHACCERSQATAAAAEQYQNNTTPEQIGWQGSNMYRFPVARPQWTEHCTCPFIGFKIALLLVGFVAPELVLSHARIRCNFVAPRRASLFMVADRGFQGGQDLLQQGV